MLDAQEFETDFLLRYQIHEPSLMFYEITLQYSGTKGVLQQVDFSGLKEAIKVNNLAAAGISQSCRTF